MELTPQVKTLYLELLDELYQFGEVGIEEKKTSFHLKNRVAFAGVHPRKNYFILNVVSSSPIKSSRINKQERVSTNRFHNKVKIEKREDIDNQLLSWLKDAYGLTA
ncbi:DUF5655 domain-containing protein [Chloroflexota bacterium]